MSQNTYYRVNDKISFFKDFKDYDSNFCAMIKQVILFCSRQVSGSNINMECCLWRLSGLWSRALIMPEMTVNT